MLKFINDNAVALPIIISLFGLAGTVLGFFIKAIYELITKGNTKKADNVKLLNNKIKTLENEKAELQKELSKYKDIEQSTTGNYLILKETGMAICPTCWDKEHLSVRIYENNDGTFQCGSCKHCGIFNKQNNLAYEDDQNFQIQII